MPKFLEVSNQAAARDAIDVYSRSEAVTDLLPASQVTARVLVERMTVQPDTERRTIIEGLVSDLVDFGLWDKLDALYVFAAHHIQAATLNWKSSVVADITVVNSPPFAVDRGFTGTGTGGSATHTTMGYLQTTTLPSAYVNFKAQDATIGVYARTYLSQNYAVDASIIGGTLLNPSASGITSSNTTLRLNSNLGSILAADTSSDRTGLFAGTRIGDTGYIYRDGVLLGSGTLGTAALPTTSANFLRGDLESLSARQLAAGFWGAALTETEHADLNIALSIYLSAIGAAV